MWNLKKKKKGKNELIYKTEVESQMLTYGYLGIRVGGGGGINLKIGIDTHIPLYIK